MDHEQHEHTLIAQECARIMLNEGIGDFARAKNKALQRLGLSGRFCLPSNLEIEAAMIEQNRLFATADALAELQAKRKASLELMQRLIEFEPRLTGSVLKGTSGIGSKATLHVFCDFPEELLFALMNQRIPYRESERFIGGKNQRLPSVLVMVNGFEVEAVIFPRSGLRQAPPSPVDGKPMRRATIEETKDLVEGNLADLFGAEGLPKHIADFFAEEANER